LEDGCDFRIDKDTDHAAMNLKLAKKARKAIESMTLAGFKEPAVFDEAKEILGDLDFLIEELERQ
jgi:hypothetical protein